MKPKKIVISGEDYFLIFNPNTCESAFTTRGDTHPAAIVIGSKYSSPKDIINDTAHEIMETILSVDNKRWADEYTNCADEGVLFVFNHGYLKLLMPKFIDALLQTGRIKLDESKSDSCLFETAKRKVCSLQASRPRRKV